MGERLSFNINAELYENQFGDLAIRFPGEKVYRDVGPETGTSFVEDAKSMLIEGKHPDGWHEMPAHELFYGRGWHCSPRQFEAILVRRRIPLAAAARRGVVDRILQQRLHVVRGQRARLDQGLERSLPQQ
jgi:hypothetical protein